MSARTEAHILLKRGKTIIPSPGRGLLKTIEGLIELVDKVWMAGINVAELLIHINVLLQSVMQKRKFIIDKMNMTRDICFLKDEVKTFVSIYGWVVAKGRQDNQKVEGEYNQDSVCRDIHREMCERERRCGHVVDEIVGSGQC